MNKKQSPDQGDLEAVFMPFLAGTAQMMLWYCFQEILVKIFSIIALKIAFFLLRRAVR
ncbi:hypothetical protein [Ruminococcus sp.]|uniref:hypothetical protein n=1 Tax=Ruminococcus sp. TaxID=41978 RepID=UPI002E809582|nr:hypothetical protein [Ruminococcus sp.]MEE3492662.1 hypothetical protein [Ruminococcus sp.]